MNPADLDDDALAAHLTTLNDAQLSDVLAAVDAAEVVSKARAIDMREAAIWYASKLKWPVFPLKPRGKTPLTRHGFIDATTNTAHIELWWRRWPDANIGVPTGPVEDGGCGYDVVDVDGPEGIWAWARIKHRECPPDCSAVIFCPAPGPFDIRAEAITPGGPGRHFYVPASGVGNATRLGDVPIDRRGAGGYVVVPPSVGLSGARYSWVKRPAMPTATAVAA